MDEFMRRRQLCSVSADLVRCLDGRSRPEADLREQPGEMSTAFPAALNHRNVTGGNATIQR